MAGKDSTKPQDSATKPADMKLWVQQRAPDGSPRVQYYRPRKTGWTTRKMARFLTALRATSNVTEAARAVKMDVSGAYGLRKKDATFAAGWAEALEQGYAELEMLLLRQSIHGSETTEMVDDGNEEGRKRTKTVHSYPHSMALRLLMAHKGTGRGVSRRAGDRAAWQRGAARRDPCEDRRHAEPERHGRSDGRGHQCMSRSQWEELANWPEARLDALLDLAWPCGARDAAA